MHFLSHIFHAHPFSVNLTNGYNVILHRVMKFITLTKVDFLSVSQGIYQFSVIHN